MMSKVEEKKEEISRKNIIGISVGCWSYMIWWFMQQLQQYC